MGWFMLVLWVLLSFVALFAGSVYGSTLNDREGGSPGWAALALGLWVLSMAAGLSLIWGW